MSQDDLARRVSEVAERYPSDLIISLIKEQARSIAEMQETIEMKFYRYLATGLGMTATLLLAGGLVLMLFTGVLFSAATGNPYAIQSFATYASSIGVAVVLYYVTWLFVRRYQRAKRDSD
jgi:hypothetical protein